MSEPIACNLAPVDYRQRLIELANLTRDALLSSTRDDLTVVLRYRREAVDRVRAMVAFEQQCCGFLTFTLSDEPDAVRVTIAAPERARDAASELFSQFTGQSDAAGNSGGR